MTQNAFEAFAAKARGLNLTEGDVTPPNDWVRVDAAEMKDGVPVLTVMLSKGGPKKFPLLSKHAAWLLEHGHGWDQLKGLRLRMVVQRGKRGNKEVSSLVIAETGGHAPAPSVAVPAPPVGARR